MDRAALLGTWIHSHEEDEIDSCVFRPQGFRLPPSRGRSGFTLAEDGAAVEFAPSASDSSSESPARWALTAENVLRIYPKSATLPIRSIRVLSVAADKLVVLK